METRLTPEGFGIASDRLGAASICLYHNELSNGGSCFKDPYSGVIARTRGSAIAAEAAMCLKLTILNDYFTQPVEDLARLEDLHEWRRDALFVVPSIE